MTEFFFIQNKKTAEFLKIDGGLSWQPSQEGCQIHRNNFGRLIARLKYWLGKDAGMISSLAVVDGEREIPFPLTASQGIAFSLWMQGFEVDMEQACVDFEMKPAPANIFGGQTHWTDVPKFDRAMEGVISPGEILMNLAAITIEYGGTVYKMRNHKEFLDLDEVKWECPGGFSTTHFLSWKTIALLRGLGFGHSREAGGDEFVSTMPVESMFLGWEPSKDGSRLQSCSHLGDPSSAHYRRRYVVAFRFTTPEGQENVIAFSCSPHQSNELHELIALSSYKDWERQVESKPEGDDSGVSEWLRANEIKLR